MNIDILDVDSCSATCRNFPRSQDFKTWLVQGAKLFLEKFSRFFRHYELAFGPRHKGGSYIPMIADENQPSILDALKERINAHKALDVQSNGDIVELMVAEHFPDRKSVVLLFHRASPNAADPTYRKKARRQVTIRKAEKEPGEEQSVSAHLVIRTDEIKQGVYQAALEEIPGLSMGVIRPIIGQALNDYTYDFEDRRGRNRETYCTFKPEGIKSETITGALKTGQMKWITLVRPAKPEFVDAEGMFQPVQEYMRIRITGEIEANTWREQLKSLVDKARGQGWEDFNIDIDLGDKRSRTVKLERDQEAKEVLFVRSEHVEVKNELSVCCSEVCDEIVKKAAGIILKLRK